jgi:hypothetical protein
MRLRNSCAFVVFVVLFFLLFLVFLVLFLLLFLVGGSKRKTPAS